MKQNNFKPSNPKDRTATNRLDLSLFPDTAICYGALGMTEGDAKYGSYNYRISGVLSSVYYAAARRHLAKWFNGENIDSQTHIPHLASALACIAILIDAVECNALRDDRPPIANLHQLFSASELLVEKIHKMFPNGPGRYTQIKKHEKNYRTTHSKESISTPKRPKNRALR